MKDGLVKGYTEKLKINVTEDMCPSFDDSVVHPTMSTVSMIYYMEWAGRKVILPFLESDEEGIGASICIEHLSPAPVGKAVVFTAEVTEMTSRKVVCSVQAEHNKGIVGQGSFVQIVASKQTLTERIVSMC